MIECVPIIVSPEVLDIAHDLAEFWDDISRENNNGDLIATFHELYDNLRETILKYEELDEI